MNFKNFLSLNEGYYDDLKNMKLSASARMTRSELEAELKLFCGKKKRLIIYDSRREFDVGVEFEAYTTQWFSKRLNELPGYLTYTVYDASDGSKIYTMQIRFMQDQAMIMTNNVPGWPVDGEYKTIINRDLRASIIKESKILPKLVEQVADKVKEHVRKNMKTFDRLPEEKQNQKIIEKFPFMIHYISPEKITNSIKAAAFGSFQNATTRRVDSDLIDFDVSQLSISEIRKLLKTGKLKVVDLIDKIPDTVIRDFITQTPRLVYSMLDNHITAAKRFMDEKVVDSIIDESGWLYRRVAKSGVNISDEQRNRAAIKDPDNIAYVNRITPEVISPNFQYTDYIVPDIKLAFKQKPTEPEALQKLIDLNPKNILYFSKPIPENIWKQVLSRDPDLILKIDRENQTADMQDFVIQIAGKQMMIKMANILLPEVKAKYDSESKISGLHRGGLFR